MSKFRLGIIANTGKESVKTVLPDFLQWLADERVSFVVADDLHELIDLSPWQILHPREIADNVDFVLSFGGDGTFLQTARLIAPREVPILGVNLGYFGYLAEVNPTEMKTRLRELLDGKYSLQERMMLGVRLENVPEEEQFYCLNDVVISRTSLARTIRLEASISGNYLNTFNADGLIVSTSTGSTGYSLSAAGPILEPTLNAIIINPICPHMLANRPIVIADSRVIEITPHTHEGIYQVSVDGMRVMEPESGKKVIIQKAPFVTKIVVFDDHDFNAILRNKLKWRDQLN